MNSSSNNESAEACFSAGPEAAVSRFYNCIFGHIRNWPMAYSCLTDTGKEAFRDRGGITAFADYWEDRLSFLEDLVKRRHREYPYRHRSCFSMDNVNYESVSKDHAAVTLELLENHLARERLVILQRKELVRAGNSWLLKDGKLEGSLDRIIVVRGLRRPGLGTAQAFLPGGPSPARPT